jgi:hypothetical protein
MRAAFKPARAVAPRKMKPQLVAGKGADEAEQQDKADIKRALLRRVAGEEKNRLALNEGADRYDEISILGKIGREHQRMLARQETIRVCEATTMFR